MDIKNQTQMIGSFKKRDFDSFFFKNKKSFIENINQFKGKIGPYKLPSIKHQLGVLLYGPPGTGKTTLIKCIGTYLNCNIKVCNLTDENDTSILTTKSDDDFEVIILEDFDKFLKHQKKDEDNKSELKEMNKKISFMESIVQNQPQQQQHYKNTYPQQPTLLPKPQPLSLDIQMFMQIMDGVSEYPGRIIIATTNHPDKIPKALLRPGRFDTILFMGHIKRTEAKEMISYMFGDGVVGVDGDGVVDCMDELLDYIDDNEITASQLERACLESYDDKKCDVVLSKLKIIQTEMHDVKVYSDSD